MSEAEVWKGKIEKIFVGTEDEREKMCEYLCQLNGLSDLKEYYETYVEQVRDELDEKYLVTKFEIYEFLELEDIQYDNFCEVTKTEPFAYEFVTNFYNGETCLSEMVEEFLREEE